MWFSWDLSKESNYLNRKYWMHNIHYTGYGKKRWRNSEHVNSRGPVRIPRWRDKCETGWEKARGGVTWWEVEPCHSVQEELEPCRLQTETVHLRLLLPICAQWLCLCKPTRLPDTGAGVTQRVGIGLPDTWGRAVGLGGRHLGQVTQVWHRTLGKGEGVVGYLLEGKEQNLKSYTCLLFTSFSAHISLLCLA